MSVLLPKCYCAHNRKTHPPFLLEQGARVAVIGGGPAGSLFSFFLLDMAERIGLKINVDIYEPRDFDMPGPTGCNMCGGVLYESLVQSQAVDGINLPETVVQRRIGNNMLHLDIGSVRIQAPRREKRIATTFRGIGPRRGCRRSTRCGQKAIHFSINVSRDNSTVAGSFFRKTSRQEQIP